MKKGVAIVSAVVVMSIVVVFSTLLFSLISAFSINTKLEQNHLKETTLVSKIYLDFIDDGEVGIYEGYHFRVIDNESDYNQKALVCSRSENITINNIFFYVIYDFAQYKTLALQRYNLYITTAEEGGETVYYLDGIVKF